MNFREYKNIKIETNSKFKKFVEFFISNDKLFIKKSANILSIYFRCWIVIWSGISSVIQKKTPMLCFLPNSRRTKFQAVKLYERHHKSVYTENEIVWSWRGLDKQEISFIYTTKQICRSKRNFQTKKRKKKN